MHSINISWCIHHTSSMIGCWSIDQQNFHSSKHGVEPSALFQKKVLSCQSQEPRTSRLARVRAADGSSSTSSLPQGIWENLGFGHDRSVYWSHRIPRSIFWSVAKVLHVSGLSVGTNHWRLWRDLGMPARRKEVVSVYRVLPLHGKSRKSGQDLDTRVRPSEAK